ncbi:MNIO family bufferin maturase [Jannaschia sp. CCS1]|uniref:MNIO family bufferin maturase n=1 Tax=Jannaschia sp. (strain CCS1) TaxID=290400 RepID=UPI00006BFFD4|nr:DUF692 domain-containing protein [Jannaschia sp. CCS1]ABD54179.1 protein of unknown function DUF692 [Jannaschia sp. CCS1]
MGAAEYASQVRTLPKLGLGVGLRNEHFNHILSERPNVDWFEAISENFMDSGGRPGWVIRQIAEHYPIVLHGVSLSIGSADPLNEGYLARLKLLADDVQAKWVSDHLCWTGVLSINSHDLLPLPLNEETLGHVTSRVHHVQEVLGRPLILENPSTYASFQTSDIPEPEFLRALSDATGCGLLLDVNNVYVSCFNDGTDPLEYLEKIPFEKVIQMHLAGHTNCGEFLLDTHDQPVTRGVWELFRLAWQRTGGAATLLEWDGDVPAFEDLHAEVLKAREFMAGEVEALHLYQGAAAPGRARVSNPVDHIVSPVRGHSRLDA